MRLYLILLVVLCGCGAPAKVPPKPKPEGSRLTGSVQTLQGESQDLDFLQGKKSVVFLASETCITCIEEAKEINEYIKGAVPSNVNFLTILVSSIAEDASDWKDRFAIPWQVAFMEDAELIPKYCPAYQTPCTIVTDEANQILFVKNGIVPPSVLQEYSGGWRW